MTLDLSDPAVAQAIVEIARKAARDEIAALVPVRQYGVVGSVDPTTMRASVILNDSGIPSAGWVYSAAETPVSGDRVRVERTPDGDRVIVATMYATMAGAPINADGTPRLTAAALDGIVSDSVLARPEKPAVIREVTALLAEQGGIDGLATGSGITTEKTTYDAAVTALSALLAALYPAWDDVTQDSPIDPAAFEAAFTNLYAARQALLNAVTSAIAGVASGASGAASDAQDAADAAAIAAAQALAAGNSVMAQLGVIAADDLLTPAEKPTVIDAWYSLTAEMAAVAAQATAYGLTALHDAYLGAFSDVDDYLISLTSPYPWNDTTAGHNTTIVGTTFLALFGGLYSARITIGNGIALATSQKALDAWGKAVDAYDDAQDALADLLNIASDSVLSRGEKPAIVRDVTTMLDEQTFLDSEAVACGLSHATFDGKVSALTSYLGSLSPAWNDATYDTTITKATWDTRWSEMYAARHALVDAITSHIKGVADTAAADVITAQHAAEDAQADATDALNGLTDIANDSVLSKGEKSAVVLDWTRIFAEQNGITAQGTAYGLTALGTDYYNAYAALWTYLDALGPDYDDTTQNTTLPPQVSPALTGGQLFRAKFSLYYSTRQLLLNAIYAAAKSLAGGAQSTATDALNSANGKNTITHSLSAASGSGIAAGDTWFQHDGSNVVIAQWRWSGSAWVPQTLGNLVIAAVDAGKITTGALTVTGAMTIGNTAGNVAITPAGITLGDSTGTTILDSSGFGAAWEALVHNGIINGRFDEGAAPSTLPHWTVTTTGDVAWSVQARDDAGGEYAVRVYFPLGGGHANGYGRAISDRVRVLPWRTYVVEYEADMHPLGHAGWGLSALVRWYDADGTQIGSDVTGLALWSVAFGGGTVGPLLKQSIFITAPALACFAEVGVQADATYHDFGEVPPYVYLYSIALHHIPTFRWRFVRIARQVLRSGYTPTTTDDYTEEATSVPANEAVAVQLTLGVRQSSGNNVSLSAKDYDGGNAGVVYTSGVAARGGFGSAGPVLVGGSNGRQFKWASSATTGVDVYIYVEGYWTAIT